MASIQREKQNIPSLIHEPSASSSRAPPSVGIYPQFQLLVVPPTQTYSEWFIKLSPSNTRKYQMNFSHLALNWLRKITLTFESFFKCIPLKTWRSHFSTLSGSNNYFQSEAVSNGLINPVLCIYNACNFLIFKTCLHLICGNVWKERESDNKNERKT